MEARVKQDYNAGPVTAFSGHEFIKSEWREVPAGFEEAARKHPLLDTRDASNIETLSLKDIQPQVELVTEKEPTLEAPTLEEIRRPRRNKRSRTAEDE